MSLSANIIILPFETKYQSGVDEMLDAIVPEYPKPFIHQPVVKMEEQYKMPGRFYWVALAGERVIGTVGVVVMDGYAILKSLFVAKDYRGAQWQVANRLMDTATAEATAQDCKYMYLGTMQQFKAAQRFYEKLGYSSVDQHELPTGYLLNDLDTVFYKKELV